MDHTDHIYNDRIDILFTSLRHNVEENTNKL